MPERESVWAKRFVGAAIIQGAVVFALMAVFMYLNEFGETGQQPSRIVAGGSVGTWVLVGFTGLLVIGVLGIGLSALFYHYIEVIRNRPYKGLNNALAWAHFVMANVGALGGGLLMVFAGFIGGSHLLTSTTSAPAVYGEVHTLIAGYVTPIGAFILLGSIGALLGGIGYVRAWFSKESA